MKAVLLRGTSGVATIALGLFLSTSFWSHAEPTPRNGDEPGRPDATDNSGSTDADADSKEDEVPVAGRAVFFVPYPYRERTPHLQLVPSAYPKEVNLGEVPRSRMAQDDALAKRMISASALAPKEKVELAVLLRNYRDQMWEILLMKRRFRHMGAFEHQEPFLEGLKDFVGTFDKEEPGTIQEHLAKKTAEYLYDHTAMPPYSWVLMDRFKLSPAERKARETVRRFYLLFDSCFRAAGDADQRAILARFNARQWLLVAERRKAVRGIFTHQRAFIEALQGDWVARVPRDKVERFNYLNEIAKNYIGVWYTDRLHRHLVDETSLHLEVYRGLLKAREECLDGSTLTPMLIEGYAEALQARDPAAAIYEFRESPDVMKVRCEMAGCALRRITLIQLRNEMHAELAFRSSTSSMISKLVDRWSPVEMGRLGEGWWAKKKASLGSGASLAIGDTGRKIEGAGDVAAEATDRFLGGLSSFVSLSTDTLGIVSTAMLDSAKNKFFEPFLGKGWEAFVKDSVEQAFESYNKAWPGIAEGIRFSGSLASRLTPKLASSCADWAKRDGHFANFPFGPANKAKIAASLARDPDLVSSTDGGLLAALAVAAPHPDQRRALYLLGAVREQEGVSMTARARLAMLRNFAAKFDGDKPLTLLEIKRLSHPIAPEWDKTKLDTNRWQYALFEGGYNAYKSIVDFPSTFRNFASYYFDGGNGFTQDAWIKKLYFRDEQSRSVLRAYSEVNYRLGQLPEGLAKLESELKQHCAPYILGLHRARTIDDKEAIIEGIVRGRTTTQPDGINPSTRTHLVAAQTRMAQQSADANFRACANRFLDLAATGDYFGASGQVKAMREWDQQRFKLTQRGPVFSEASYKKMETLTVAQAHREAVSRTYDGLYQMAASQLIFAAAAHSAQWVSKTLLSATGKVKFNPGTTPAGTANLSTWQAVKKWTTGPLTSGANKALASLNPLYYNFSAAGVGNMVKNTFINGTSEIAGRVVAVANGYDEQRTVDLFDKIAGVAEDTADGLFKNLWNADYDFSVDTKTHLAMDYVKKREAVIASAKKASDWLDSWVPGKEPPDVGEAEADILRGQGNLDASAETLEHLRALSNTARNLARSQHEMQAPGRYRGEVFKKLLDRVSGDGTLRPEDLGAALSELGNDGASRLFNRDSQSVDDLRRAIATSMAWDRSTVPKFETHLETLQKARLEHFQDVLGKIQKEFPGSVVVTGSTGAGGQARTGGSFFDDLHVGLAVKAGTEVEVADKVSKMLQEQLGEKATGSSLFNPNPYRNGTRNRHGIRFHVSSVEKIRKNGLDFKLSTAPLITSRLGTRGGVDAPKADTAEAMRALGSRERAYAEAELKTKMDSIAAQAEEISQLSGFHPKDIAAMWAFAELHGGIMITRDSNVDSLQWRGSDGKPRPGYTAKPMTCKAKTAKVGEHKGLVVNPEHATQKAAWDTAINEAADTDTRAKLIKDRAKAVATWEKYGAKMKASGFSEDADGCIIDSRGQRIFGDYDGHGMYVPGADNKMGRFSYGDGTGAGAEDDARRKASLGRLNGFLGREVALHGFQDDWNPGDMIKMSDPPVTVFVADQHLHRVNKALGVLGELPANSRPHPNIIKLETPEQMRLFYEAAMNVRWAYPDGYGDRLSTKIDKVLFTKYLDGETAKAPAIRRLFSPANRRILHNSQRQAQQAAEGQMPPEVPIPTWMAYHMALAEAGNLGFLTDPRFDRRALELASFDTKVARCGEFLAASAVIDRLLQAWLIARDPKGKHHLHSVTQPGLKPSHWTIALARARQLRAATGANASAADCLTEDDAKAFEELAALRANRSQDGGGFASQTQQLGTLRDRLRRAVAHLHADAAATFFYAYDVALDQEAEALAESCIDEASAIYRLLLAPQGDYAGQIFCLPPRGLGYQFEPADHATKLELLADAIARARWKDFAAASNKRSEAIIQARQAGNAASASPVSAPDSSDFAKVMGGILGVARRAWAITAGTPTNTP